MTYEHTKLDSIRRTTAQTSGISKAYDERTTDKGGKEVEQRTFIGFVVHEISGMHSCVAVINGEHTLVGTVDTLGQARHAIKDAHLEAGTIVHERDAA